MEPQKKRSIRDFFTPVPRPSLGTNQPSTPPPAPTPPQHTANTNLQCQPLSASHSPHHNASDSIGVRIPRPEHYSTGPRAEPPDSPIPPKPAQFAPATTRPNSTTTTTTLTNATPTNSVKPLRDGSSDALPPLASQSSINSGSSKRVVSNGEEVVLNSDSDTDSLPDLDWGDQPSSNSFKMPTPTSRAKPNSGRNDNALRKPPTKTETQGKHGKRVFSQLLQNAQKNADMERKIAESKADLDKPVEEPSQDLVISEEKLEEAIGDDEDPEKAKRLYRAMQRTNAMHMDYVFNLFEDSLHPPPIQSKFPIDSLPKHRWASIFEDESTRDQAFITGFAEQMFRLQELPQELACWLIEQICVGSGEALNVKYIKLLENHSQHFRTVLDRAKVDTLFAAIGVDTQSIAAMKEVKPLQIPHASLKEPPPTSVRFLAQLLQSAAPSLSSEASSHALYILFHVCMDHSVIADPITLHGVQDAIEALMCNTDNTKLTSMLSEVIPLLHSRITHPILQKHLVVSLPTQTPLTAYFQRHLALSFLLYPTPLDVPLSDPKIPGLIHSLLRKSPGFRIQRDTNYSDLSARLLLLDIAIGPGPLSVPYQPLLDPSVVNEGNSPSVAAPFPVSSEEKLFNKEVDNLAQHVKLLGNSISEAGAMVDLTRLDAKDRSERLYHRLDHAVRIGGKQFQNVFGNDTESEFGKRVWKKWLGDKSGTSTPASAAGD